MPAVEVQHLTKRYGSRIGVEELSFSVQAGCRFGFLGPNGAGKTTTIRVLMGLLRPTRGGARVNGLDCWTRSDRIKESVGYLPGDLRLYSWLSARLAVRLCSKARGRDLTREARRLMGLFQLDERLRVRSMSRGTRQKLGLVMALAHGPRVVILDEPTASLDPLMQAALHGELRRLASEGACIFLSSHSLGEVEKLCDQVGIMRDGRLVELATLEQLSARAQRRVSIRWRGTAQEAALSPPPCLEDVVREAGRWRGTLRAPAMELVDWCRGRSIDDLTIEKPDLSTLFESYYR